MYTNKKNGAATNGRPTWIWFPGDMEVWVGNRFNNRRTERGAMFPPFWKQDSHWPTVLFRKEVYLDVDQHVSITVEGAYNLSLDGKLQRGMPRDFVVPAGKHTIEFKVWNQASPPTLFIDGGELATNDSWLCTYEDKIWIDENGVAHGSGIYVPAGCWDFHSASDRPSSYRLHTRRQSPVSAVACGDGVLYDFERETFGYVVIGTESRQGTISVYYGESKEEAIDKQRCETLDIVQVDRRDDRPIVLESKAFRFVYIECEEGATVESVSVDFEYSPSTECERGRFRCDDELVNRIWQTSAYTLDLTTREFFLDGIKRDRWTWSGDAIQSYQMNYYHRFDAECVKRTIRQLRGKDPVTAHVNTIMDYTFYWMTSVADYYQYTGDKDFIVEIYPRMVTLMEYCTGRLNEDGMAEGKSDDWIFVDWVDFPMHKRGTLCFEQVLFCKAIDSLALCARVCGDIDAACRYSEMSKRLLDKIRKTFWSEELHAFTHSIEEGQANMMVTKFPNMFAVIYGYADDHERTEILKHVMLNPSVPPITTPYMRYYELEALCMQGQHDYVMNEIRDYWGGMLKEGATTFWEKYDPKEHGRQHLTMYGRPYGKSLCHAWGASPLYLLGKYFLGVSPVKAGYEEFEVSPVLGTLKWMEGTVPTPHGEIDVYIDDATIRVKATEGEGFLYFESSTTPRVSTGTFEELGNCKYRLWIETGVEVTVCRTRV